MVKKIRPISRIIKITTEVSPGGTARFQKASYLDWDERWSPRVDIYEKQQEIVIEAEVPGMPRADLTITVHSNQVEIKGTKKEGLSSGQIRYLRLERGYGSFRRLLALPSTVVPDKAKAYLENGILTIVLKKYRPKEDNTVSEKIPRNEA